MWALCGQEIFTQEENDLNTLGRRFLQQLKSPVAPSQWLKLPALNLSQGLPPLLL